MGRSPCSNENRLKKGSWTLDEDEKLRTYIKNHGHGSWRALPKNAGLNRCGKSCRLRWTNYLKPDIKRGNFSEEEEQIILHWHSILGNKWSSIASFMPGRTDNEIKNFWNTHMKKKLVRMGFDPITHTPLTDPANLIRSDLHQSTEALPYLQNFLNLTATTPSLISGNPYSQSLWGQLGALHMLCTQPLLQPNQYQSLLWLSQLYTVDPQIQHVIPSSCYVPTISSLTTSELAQSSHSNSLLSQLVHQGDKSSIITSSSDSCWSSVQLAATTWAPPAAAVGTSTSINNLSGGGSSCFLDDSFLLEVEEAQALLHEIYELNY